MSEQKHFKYEGNVNLSPQGQVPIENITVKDVRFLMPVRIDMDIDGKVVPVFASMDLAHKEVYFDWVWLNDDVMKEKVFEYLRIKNTLPEDQYGADEDTYTEINRARDQHEQLKGEYNE